jgi:hypothetical protein
VLDKLRKTRRTHAAAILALTSLCLALTAVVAEASALHAHAATHRPVHVRRATRCASATHRLLRQKGRRPRCVRRTTRKLAVIATSRKTVSVHISTQPVSPTPATSARFTWTTTGPVSSTTCSLDTGAFRACASGVNYGGLTARGHSLTVRVANSQASAQVADSWTVSSTTTTTTTTTTAPPATTTPTTPTTTTPTTTTPTPAPVANTFAANIPGIAAGGSLQNEDATTQARDLSLDTAAGARWIRLDINWAQIQNGGPASYNWAPQDALIQRAEAAGLNVLGVILYTPAWARPARTGSNYGPSPSAYATFASTAVAHYAAMGVHAYEVWNEPNTSNFWAPAPDPAAYTALLRAAYVAIKGSDPNATVVTGGTAPAPTNATSYSPVDFLSAIYANGGGGYFDAVGHHPYCAPANPGDAQAWSAWYQMYGTSPSLRSVMVANGDGDKKIWATEYGAPTNGPAGSFVTQAQQATMITRAYQLFASYPWAGPLFFYQGRDQGTDTSTRENFYGFLNYDSTPKPSYAAYRAVAAAL